MNLGRRELVRYVRSLEARDNPRREEDFTSLPLGTMVRHTLNRIISGALIKLGVRKRAKK